MKTSFVVIIVLTFFSVSLAQDTSQIALLDQRVRNLAEITSDLLNMVDSLNNHIEHLEKEIDRLKWVQVDEGMEIDEVVEVLGNPDELKDAGYGFQKMIFGEGYSGYVLVKDSVVVDSSPPLYLRLESELIKK